MRGCVVGQALLTLVSGPEEGAKSNAAEQMNMSMAFEETDDNSA